MMKSRLLLFGLLAVSLFFEAEAKAELMPVGAQVQVNEVTTGRQLNPAVTSLGDDLFAVVWEGEDSDGRGIFGRRLNQAGAMGSDFQVSVVESGDQTSVEAASLGDGSFVVVWEHEDYPTLPAVHSRRFDSAGMPSTVVTVAPTQVDHSAYLPSIVSPDGSGFVVVWEDYFPGSDSVSFHGRFLDASGQNQGDSLTLVALGQDESLSEPKASPRNGSGFSLSWDFNDAMGDELSTQAFDVSGIGQGMPVIGSESGFDPAHASLDDGSFFMVWTDLTNGIQRRRMFTDGTGNLPVDVSDTLPFQRDPVVVALPGARAAIAWWETDNGEPTRIMLQVVAADDSVESQVTVDEVAASAGRPRLAYSTDLDELGVVWDRRAPDGDLEDVRFQRYTFAGIFSDGFESGNTSAWSSP